MNYFYLKLYHEILDDPKMGRLSDHLYRRTIEIFLIASSRKERDGFLPPIEEMAWKLRTTATELAVDLEQIAALGMVKNTENGWYVTNFVKRQEAALPKDRVQRYRERKRSGNEDVTDRNLIKLDIELIKDIDNVVVVDKNAGEIYKLYEREIGPLTQFISDDIDDALNTYPAEWIPAAIQRAARANIRKWSYILGILNNWQTNGFQADTRPVKPPTNGKNGVDETLAELEKRRGDN